MTFAGYKFSIRIRISLICLKKHCYHSSNPRLFTTLTFLREKVWNSLELKLSILFFYLDASWWRVRIKRWHNVAVVLWWNKKWLLRSWPVNLLPRAVVQSYNTRLCGAWKHYNVFLQCGAVEAIFLPFLLNGLCQVKVHWVSRKVRKFGEVPAIWINIFRWVVVLSSRAIDRSMSMKGIREKLLRTSSSVPPQGSLPKGQATSFRRVWPIPVPFRLFPSLMMIC